MLGGADAAADATQDAFLLAHGELGSLARSGESFGPAVFGAARRMCYELLARDAGVGRRGPASSLSAAAARLRPQQRAALALTGLEGLSYAEIATVLGIGAHGVGALLARARLRLHDELHGTALAAAAVRAPDCEDVVPLLAAAADGELDATDAAWADPHVGQCSTCPRTRRAMDDTAATYAAWSSAVPPAWLGEATLAELGLQVPVARGAGRAAAGAWTTPRPGLSAALLGAALLGVACAALLVAASGSLRQRDPAIGGASLPEAARSLQVAGVPAARAARTRAPHRARRAAAKRRPRRVALTPVRAVRPVTAPRRPAATRRPVVAPAQPPASRPKRRRNPAPAAPAPAQPATTKVPTPPTPANPAAPADGCPARAARLRRAARPRAAPQRAAPLRAARQRAPRRLRRRRLRPRRAPRSPRPCRALTRPPRPRRAPADSAAIGAAAGTPTAG
jgi:DNA-binding CsgD family transcriptional regulator